MGDRKQSSCDEVVHWADRVRTHQTSKWKPLFCTIRDALWMTITINIRNNKQPTLFFYVTVAHRQLMWSLEKEKKTDLWCEQYIHVVMKSPTLTSSLCFIEKVFFFVFFLNVTFMHLFIVFSFLRTFKLLGCFLPCCILMHFTINIYVFVTHAKVLWLPC